MRRSGTVGAASARTLRFCETRFANLVHHLSYQVELGSVDALYSPTTAVAQHGDAVGNFISLIQKVGDKKNREALIAEASNYRE